MKQLRGAFHIGLRGLPQTFQTGLDSFKHRFNQRTQRTNQIFDGIRFGQPFTHTRHFFAQEFERIYQNIIDKFGNGDEGFVDKFGQSRTETVNNLAYRCECVGKRSQRCKYDFGDIQSFKQRIQNIHDSFNDTRKCRCKFGKQIHDGSQPIKFANLISDGFEQLSESFVNRLENFLQLKQSFLEFFKNIIDS